MESSVFLSDLLTAHEPELRNSLQCRRATFRFMGRLPRNFRALDPEPGRDGALRRPRRVQRRNDAARCFAGGDIAARCPYQSQVHEEGSVKGKMTACRAGREPTGPQVLRLIETCVAFLGSLIFFHPLCRMHAAVPLPAGYTIPIVDISSETNRQVIVDREPGQYLGHPTTVLLEDGKTVLTVYPKG